MHVRIVKARHDEAPSGVDNARRCSYVRGNALLATDETNLAPTNRQSARPRLFRINGVDGPIPDHEISMFRQRRTSR